MTSLAPRSGRDNLSLTRGLSSIGEPQMLMLASPGRSNPPNLPKCSPPGTVPSPGRYIPGSNHTSSALTAKSWQSNSFSFSTVPEPSTRQESTAPVAPRLLGSATPSASPTAAHRRPTHTAIPMQNNIILSRALDMAATYRRQIMDLYTRADALDTPTLKKDDPIPLKSIYSHLSETLNSSDPASEDVTAWMEAVATTQQKLWQEASKKLHHLQQQESRATRPSQPVP